MYTGQRRRFSILLCVAVLVLVVTATILTYLAPPAQAQTFPNFSGGWTGTRTQTGAVPPGLPATSNQTLTLFQTAPGGNVVGTLATYWPGTPYYWTSYASGTITGSTMAFTFTPTVSNLPAGTMACGESLSLALASSGGVTTATVPAYHPCGGTTSTFTSYPFTLIGWQKMYGTETSGCAGPCISFASTGGSSIDNATGNVIEPEVDYQTAGPNKLSLVRYYNSYTAGSRYTFGYLIGNNVPHVTTNYDRGLVFGSIGTASTVTAYRPDGSQLIFTLMSGVWTPDSDVDMVLTNTSGSTWTLTDHEDNVETYTVTTGNGLLNSIKTRNGYTQTLNYNPTTHVLSSVTDSYSRTLTFNYTGGYLTSVNTPDSLVLSYAYDSTGITPGVNDRIASVSYNTSPPTSVTYGYTNSSFPYAVTSIPDENGNPYKTYTYDTYGRALKLQVGTGTNADVTSVAYNDTAGTSTVTNALSQSVVNTYVALQGRNKSAKQTRTASTNVPAASSTAVYDSNGYVATSTDWNGNKTVYTNNTHGDPTTVVEASGTASARTTTIAYDTTWVHLPATITTTGLTTGFTYDTNGNPLTQTQTDTTTQTIPYSTNGQTRTTNFTWSNFLPLTVQTPNGNTTTYTFGTDGALTNVQNALLQNTAITSHTGGGLPLTVVDPNGVTTTLTYSPRNWLLTSTVSTTAGPITTTNTFDAVGNLTKVQQPDGSYLMNAYDTAHRLTTVTDAFGNSINYTLDPTGDRKGTDIKDPSGTLTRSLSATFDTLGRALTSVAGMSQTTTWQYDDNGNVTGYLPPALHFGYLFDQLDRATRMTFYTISGYNYAAYDAHDHVTGRTDTLSRTTSYVLDGFGDVIQAASPDTGTTVFHFDSDGNLIQKTDGAGIIANHTYDALDRILTTTYPASTGENVSYTYDQTGTGFSFGIGRLTSLTDQAGSLTHAYDERGNLLTETRTSGATALTTTYTYDAASRLLTMTYPDTSIVTYTRDTMGRVTAVSDKPAGAGSSTTLASGITYKPFGPWSGFTYGNGIVETPTLDADYRLTRLVDAGTATVQDISYVYSVIDQPNTVTDNLTSANSITSVVNDPYVHLASYRSNGVLTQIIYDGNNNLNNGNRTRFTGTIYTNTSGTDQLATIATGGVTTTVSTNANGNITGFSPGFGSAGVTTLAYNNANRLSSVSNSGGTLGSYVYDAFGNRFSKTTGTATALFTHSGGALIAETTSGTATDYIYLNGRPLAMLTGTTFTYLHDDNLGTPRVATNASQAVVWSASYLPFGETRTTTGTFTQPLRFPGQYADAESGFSHNGFRDYVPSLGRYVEADPIGIYPNSGVVNTGMNPYIYAGNDPLRTTDPTGLAGLTHGDGGNCYWNADNQPAPKFLCRHKRIIYVPIGLTTYLLPPAACGAGGPCDQRPLFTDLDLFLILLGVETKKPEVFAEIEEAQLVRYSPVNPGPLSDDIANTFRSATYDGSTLTEETTLYRMIGDDGNPIGSFWTRVEPSGPLQSVVDSALDQNWGNTATNVVMGKFPAGTEIFEGTAAAQRGLVGGGNQIYVPSVDPAWVHPGWAHY
jgi:RHS repeat-associated protein